MKSKEQKSSGCGCGSGTGKACCSVEALVSVDGRGQLVLPSDLRKKIGLKAGDKLAVVTWEQEGETCCVTLIRADKLAGMVKDLLGPMMGQLNS